MNEFARWSFNSPIVATVVGFIVLGLSLRPSATRVLFMACGYAVVSIASSWAGIFRQVVDIRMAIAFGGHVSPLPYLILLLESAFYLVPIYGLFVSVPAGRRLGFISFFIILPIMVVVEIVALQLFPELGGGRRAALERGLFAIPHGRAALLLAALWLRIHSCRLQLQPTGGVDPLS